MGPAFTRQNEPEGGSAKRPPARRGARDKGAGTDAALFGRHRAAWRGRRHPNISKFFPLGWFFPRGDLVLRVIAQLRRSRRRTSFVRLKVIISCG